MARPKPNPAQEAQPFWDGAARGELWLQRDAAGEWRFYPRGVSPDPARPDAAPTWERASGLGRVHAYSTIHRPSDVAFADLTPYTVALVDLDEGPRLLASVAREDVDRLAIDRRVRIGFENVDGTPLPVAEPLAGEDIR